METRNKTIKDSINEFYKTNNFDDDGGIKKTIAWIKFGFISFPLPNFESRKKNVQFHDINHIITGFDTTWKGESSVSAWEISSGGWTNNFIPWILTLWAMGLGVIFHTKSTIQAFKKGLTMNNSLVCGIPKDEIYTLSEFELKNQLSNLPKKNKNLIFWAFLSLIVFFTPFVIGTLILLTSIIHLK